MYLASVVEVVYLVLFRLNCPVSMWLCGLRIALVVPVSGARVSCRIAKGVEIIYVWGQNFTLDHAGPIFGLERSNTKCWPHTTHNEGVVDLTVLGGIGAFNPFNLWRTHELASIKLLGSVLEKKRG